MASKGWHHTEESRKKMSASHKGVPLSEEHRRNIGLSGIGRIGAWRGKSSPMKGKHLSEESKNKLSVANKGKRRSPETEFVKGFTPWITGRKHSEETKKKMREKRLSEETKNKLSMALRGRKLSAEHIKKALSRRTPTSLEKKFQGIIDKNGLPYKFVGDGSFMIGRKNPDFINTNGEKIAIEVYARYYKLKHAETVQEWQEERERIFKEHGWRVLFFDAMQVTEDNVLMHLGEVA
jgi:very-short-patch-repair endonuclease